MKVGIAMMFGMILNADAESLPALIDPSISIVENGACQSPSVPDSATIRFRLVGCEKDKLGFNVTGDSSAKGLWKLKIFRAYDSECERPSLQDHEIEVTTKYVCGTHYRLLNPVILAPK